jgi:hypothetical protein
VSGGLRASASLGRLGVGAASAAMRGALGSAGRAASGWGKAGSGALRAGAAAGAALGAARASMGAALGLRASAGRAVSGLANAGSFSGALRAGATGALGAARASMGAALGVGASASASASGRLAGASASASGTAAPARSNSWLSRIPGYNAVSSAMSAGAQAARSAVSTGTSAVRNSLSMVPGGSAINNMMSAGRNMMRSAVDTGRSALRSASPAIQNLMQRGNNFVQRNSQILRTQGFAAGFEHMTNSLYNKGRQIAKAGAESVRDTAINSLGSVIGRERASSLVNTGYNFTKGVAKGTEEIGKMAWDLNIANPNAIVSCSSPACSLYHISRTPFVPCLTRALQRNYGRLAKGLGYAVTNPREVLKGAINYDDFANGRIAEGIGKFVVGIRRFLWFHLPVVHAFCIVSLAAGTAVGSRNRRRWHCGERGWEDPVNCRASQHASCGSSGPAISRLKRRTLCHAIGRDQRGEARAGFRWSAGPAVGPE